MFSFVNRRHGSPPSIAVTDLRHQSTSPFFVVNLQHHYPPLIAIIFRWHFGAIGAIKSALISRIAQGHGIQVLSIHTDEQIDKNTLVGSYVSAEQPGEFRWQSGFSTHVGYMNGLLVVFEDIYNAHADVRSMLLPLLESSTSFLTVHGEEITVNEGFRLFAIVSSSSLDASLGEHWRKVMVPSPSSSDLETIVKAWYPNMESLSWKLIGSYQS